MKIIQYFRTSTSSETESLNEYFKFSSITLSFLEAKRHYDVELWTDEEGIKLVAGAPWLSYKKINKLPPCDEYHQEIYDDLFIAAQQNSPFVVIQTGVFMKTKIPLEATGAPIVLYSISDEPASIYIHKANVENITGAIGTVEHLKGFDLSLFGGSDFSFWTDYHCFVKGWLANNPRANRLPEMSFKYLIQSYLLQTYIALKSRNIKLITERPFRIPNLKSANELFMLHRNSWLIVIPKVIQHYQEVGKFVVDSLKLRFSQEFNLLFNFFSVETEKELREISTKNSPNNSFLKTTELVKLFINPNVDFLTEKDIHDIINNDAYLTFAPNHIRDLLLDVFEFESHFNKFLGSVSSKAEKEVKAFPSYPAFKEIINETISLSNSAHVTYSKWDWRTGLKLKELNELKVIANASMEPGSYTSLFLYDWSTQSPVAYSIDSLNEIIISVFSTPKYLEKANEEVMSFFDENDVTLNYDSIREIVSLRIYDLLLLNVLVYNGPEAAK